MNARLDHAVDAAIDRALTELELDLSYRLTVKRFLHSNPEAWEVCCGSACEPCVLDLAAAVRRVRELLEPAP